MRERGAPARIRSQLGLPNNEFGGDHVVGMGLLLGCAVAMPPLDIDVTDDGFAVNSCCSWAKYYKTARVEWNKAVSEEDTSAMNNLGYLSSEGLGGERDEVTAVHLCTEAAQRGHFEAALHLGKAYEDGKGVDRSDVDAYAWYRCAVASARASSAKGDDVEEAILKDANDALARLMAVFSPKHFDEAQKLAGRYVQTYAAK